MGAERTCRLEWALRSCGAAGQRRYPPRGVRIRADIEIDKSGSDLAPGEAGRLLRDSENRHRSIQSAGGIRDRLRGKLRGHRRVEDDRRRRALVAERAWEQIDVGARNQ